MIYSSNNYNFFIFIFINSIIPGFFGIFKESLGGSGSVIALFLSNSSSQIFFGIFKESLGGSGSGIAIFLSVASFHIFFGNLKESFGGSGSGIALFLSVASFHIFLVFSKKALEVQVQVLEWRYFYQLLRRIGINHLLLR